MNIQTIKWAVLAIIFIIIFAGMIVSFVFTDKSDLEGGAKAGIVAGIVVGGIIAIIALVLGGMKFISS